MRHPRPLSIIVFALILAVPAALLAQSEYLEPGKSGILLFGEATRLDRSDYSNNGIHGGGIAFSHEGKLDFGVTYAEPEGWNRDAMVFFGVRYFPMRRGEDMPADIGLLLGMSMQEDYLGMHLGCTFSRYLPVADSVAFVPGVTVEVANLFALEEYYSDQTESGIGFHVGLHLFAGRKVSFIVEPGYVLGDENAFTLSAGFLIGSGSLFGRDRGPSDSVLN